jgi:capsid protein
VIRECMNEPGLEFVWVGDDAIDPREQAQTLQILVGAGMKTREEARADLGLAPEGGGRGRSRQAWGSTTATTTSAGGLRRRTMPEEVQTGSRRRVRKHQIRPASAHI